MPKTTKHFYCQNCFETNRAGHMISAQYISELWIVRHLIPVTKCEVHVARCFPPRSN